MISRKFIGKVFVCLSLFFSAFQNASAQEKPEPLTLNDILAKLTFTSRIDKTVAQINAKLVEQIEERKVGFKITKDDEQKIKQRGGNLVLIKAVEENFLETRSPELIAQQNLYEKFIACYPKTDLESRKLCLKVAKEFIDKFKDDPEVKAQIDYFRVYVPQMKDFFKLIDEPCYFKPRLINLSASEELQKMYVELFDCSKKTDLESRKSCLAFAKEFIKKVESENLSGEQIDAVKQYIRQTEKIIEMMSKKN